MHSFSCFFASCFPSSPRFRRAGSLLHFLLQPECNQVNLNLLSSKRLRLLRPLRAQSLLAPSGSMALPRENQDDSILVSLGLPDPRVLREVGDEAVWTLSSAKPRYDVRHLRDDDLETYWQSDGPSPHTISIQFPRKITIEEIAVFINFKQDESYTPSRISLSIGTKSSDLEELKQWDLQDRQGWCRLLLSKTPRAPVRANFFQLCILANHQSGRDTHIRQVKIFGPRLENTGDGVDFSTTEFNMFKTLR